MGALSRLAAAFLEGLPHDCAVQIGDLEAALGGVVERARAAPRGVAIDDAAFVGHLGAVLATGAVDEATLAALEVDDLVLAFGCGAGDPGAVAEFEQRYADDLRAILSRFGEGRELTDEVHQRMRQRLFVAEPGERPGIWRYTGKGALLAFVRVTAVRIALDVLRARGARRETTDEELADLPAAGNPELQYLKLLYRREFKTAFEAAFARLPARARTLIRCEVIDRLSIDKLAAIYDIHRSTAARQLNQARRALVESTRDELARRLNLDPGELDSVMRLIESDVDLSVERIFARD